MNSAEERGKERKIQIWRNFTILKIRRVGVMRNILLVVMDLAIIDEEGENQSARKVNWS